MIPPPPRPDLHDEAQTARSVEVPWRWWHVVALYLGVNLGVGLLIAVPFADRLSDGDLVLLLSLVLDVVLLIAMVVFVRRFSARPAADVGLPPPDLRRRTFLRGVPTGIAMYLLAAAAQSALRVALSATTGRDIDPPAQLPDDLTGVAIGVAVVLAVVVAPVAEEVFFRGLLFRSLRRHGFWPAALVSGGAFGAVHIVGGPVLDGLLLQLPLAGVGVGLAWIVDRWGLSAAVGAHVCFNAIGLVLILSVG